MHATTRTFMDNNLPAKYNTRHPHPLLLYPSINKMEKEKKAGGVYAYFVDHMRAEKGEISRFILFPLSNQQMQKNVKNYTKLINLLRQHIIQKLHVSIH